MTEEIGRLGLLVNEFDHPFHPHPGFLKTYKKVRCVVQLLSMFSSWRHFYVTLKDSLSVLDFYGIDTTF